jgi:hypothetical protein
VKNDIGILMEIVLNWRQIVLSSIAIFTIFSFPSSCVFSFFLQWLIVFIAEIFYLLRLISR